MATQTSGLIQAVDPDVYARQAADETFVDAATPGSRNGVIAGSGSGASVPSASFPGR